MGKMTVTTTNKHELRTRETRALLLDAARTIFARDGYEGSELGEIAALAGRTKGAIYAQFKSKEDIFIALVEETVCRYRAEMQERLAQSTTVAGNKAALRAVYLHSAEDQTWSLLLLEFKLFAMRHPESRQRLNNLYAGLFSEHDEDRFAAILGPAGTSEDAISRVIAVEALQPVISALVLEAQMKANLADKCVMAKVANRIFDALFDAPA
ncbi:MAG: regulatory protein TetR [Acidobacteriaceae bacterium]|nr:regulatory protein TetR [Acidobacteriaceae bacterium]